MAGKWDISGLDELGNTLAKIAKALEPDKVESILNDGAKTISKAIRRNAPLGPTGNLKKEVKTQTLQPLERNSPAASIAAVDFKIAPHAWLVEYGHNIPGGGRVQGKGYFRRAVDETSGQVILDVTKKVLKLLDDKIGG